MTLMEIVERLQREGNIVSYRIRSDGGILITSINRKKYSGAEGNKIARNIVGATLSEAKTIQLASIKPKKGQSPKSRKLPTVEEELKKYLHKVQRIWRKNVDKSKGKITLKKLRWNIQNLGVARAKEKLEQAMRYAQGLAYSKNIEALLGYINELQNKLSSPADIKALESLKEEIISNSDRIREEWISSIYDLLYDINHGRDVRDVANAIIYLINTY